jgi:hypothetical protein
MEVRPSMRRAMLLFLLASEGCTSFAYSRFSPQRSGTASASECTEWPPFVDGIAAGLLGLGGLTAQGLGAAAAECGQYPNDDACRFHAKYFIPAIVAAASMSYGIAAYAVCEHRLASPSSGDWHPRVEEGKAPGARP